MTAKSVVSTTSLMAAIALAAPCSANDALQMITIADARVDKAEFVDIGEAGDSPGDMFVFDQPLLDEHGANIGNNSGVCIRTRVGHSLQCQWTLTMADGTVQVAGREFDKGASDITIVGGTGKYTGISGFMQSVNNEDGTFTQTLHYLLP